MRVNNWWQNGVFNQEDAESHWNCTVFVHWQLTLWTIQHWPNAPVTANVCPQEEMKISSQGTHQLGQDFCGIPRIQGKGGGNMPAGISSEPTGGAVLGVWVASMYLKLNWFQPWKAKEMPFLMLDPFVWVKHPILLFCLKF